MKHTLVIPASPNENACPEGARLQEGSKPEGGMCRHGFSSGLRGPGQAFNSGSQRLIFLIISTSKNKVVSAQLFILGTTVGSR